jgi:hypothetical protein
MRSVGWSLLVAVTVLGSALSEGQSLTTQPVGRIVGRVTSAGVHDPLPGAVISALRQGHGVVATTETDRMGRFTVDRLSAGQYSVEFDFPGFDIVRRNNVAVSEGDATLMVELRVSSICECITYQDLPSTRFTTVSGLILDQEGRPLSHTSLEIRGAPPRPNRGYAGLAGEFTARLPIGARCTLVAGRAGFSSASREFTVSAEESIVMRLNPAPDVKVPDQEDLSRGCRCADSLFFHKGW